MIDTGFIAAVALGLNTLFIPLFGWIWSRENKIVTLETEVSILKRENKEIKQTLDGKFDLMFKKFDELKDEIHKIELKVKE
jgi:hypothetical protein